MNATVLNPAIDWQIFGAKCHEVADFRSFKVGLMSQLLVYLCLTFDETLIHEYFRQVF